MFCPNCGTKNDDSAVKCSQCGFDQKKAGTPKFKGTMMLEAPPRVNPGAPAPSAKLSAQARPNLKGTMVGVAPPDLELLRKQTADALAAKKAAASTAVTAAPPAEKARVNMKGTMVGVAPPSALRKQAEADAKEKNKGPASPARPDQARPAAKPNFKGTMVGLAPPDVDELRKQADQAAQAKKQVSSAKGPPSHLKGTMIGVAPPNMQAELEKAKQTILEQKALKQAALSKPAASKASTDASSALDRSSKLKGTMIGVAPPEMQAELAQARKDFENKRAEETQSRATQAAAQKKNDPPSEPDPFKGTVIGTSPFATPPSVQASQPSPGDFSEDTPAALSSQREATRRSSAGGPPSDFAAAAAASTVPMSAHSSPAQMPASAGTVQMPTSGNMAEMPASMDTAEMLAMGDLPPVNRGNPVRSPASTDDEGDEKSTSLGTTVMVGLVVTVIVVGIAAFFLTRGGDETAVETPAAKDPIAEEAAPQDAPVENAPVEDVKTGETPAK